MDPPGHFSFGNLVLLLNVELLFYSKLSLGAEDLGAGLAYVKES